MTTHTTHQTDTPPTTGAHRMHQATGHPHYRIEMELLCCLPVAPNVARMDELAEDLGLADANDAHNLIRELRDLGCPVDTGQLRGVWCASIPDHAWAVVRKAGQAYWRRVYGPGAKQPA